MTPSISPAERRKAFQDGFSALSSKGFALIVWGLVTGVAMAKSSLTPGQAVGMSLLVFAGSAQLASLPLFAAHMPLWVIWLTATVVNLRFVIFSAGLQPYFKNRPFWQRLCLGYLNGDLGYMQFLQRYPQISDDARQVPFYLGITAANWVCWQIGSMMGIFLATWVPNAWGLGFAGTLALVAIVLPVVDHGNALVAALSAAIVALLTVNLPFKLNLVCAVLAAIAVGLALDKAQAAKQGKVPPQDHNPSEREKERR